VSDTLSHLLSSIVFIPRKSDREKQLERQEKEKRKREAAAAVGQISDNWEGNAFEGFNFDLVEE
jgi:hypothetical protein